MQRSETTMDDLGAAIGYTNARIVQAWWPGRALYVPVKADSAHPLAQLLDMRCLRVLVERWPGQQIKVPTEVADDRARRERRIAERLVDGADPADIGREFDLTARRVQQIREELALRGWLRLAEGSKRARSSRYRILGTGEVADEDPGV